MRTGILAAICIILVGCATHDLARATSQPQSRAIVAPTTVPVAENANPQVIRQRFVPAAPHPGKNNANWTALHASSDPNAKWALVNAGVGDSFPVQGDGKTRFTITCVEGNDDHLILQVDEKAGGEKIELRRDKPTTLKVDGVAYELLFPTVTVNATDPPTTTTAMIIVKQST